MIGKVLGIIAAIWLFFGCLTFLSIFTGTNRGLADEELSKNNSWFRFLRSFFYCLLFWPLIGAVMSLVGAYAHSRGLDRELYRAA